MRGLEGADEARGEFIILDENWPARLGSPACDFFKVGALIGNQHHAINNGELSFDAE